MLPTMKTSHCTFIILLLATFMSSASRGQAVEGEEEINPVGRAVNYGLGKAPKLALWYADGMWHIRGAAASDTKSKFHGFVYVDGGTIVDWKPVELELGGKTKGKGSDRVGLDAEKKELQFNFHSTGGLDGIDFKISDDAKTAKFSLLINTLDDPKNVEIGKKKDHPSKNPFVFPANPDEKSDTPDKPKGKKKKDDA
jgi:hypothetical protein